MQVQLVEQWVHRRIERVSFLDDRAIRRQVSLDFELPDHAPASDLGESDHYLVPLALLRKTPLVGFDLRDESGASVPVLTRHQNGDVAWSVLVAYAEAITIDIRDDDPLPEGLLDDLRTITTTPPDEARACRFRLDESEEELAQFLMQDEVFVNLVTDFIDNFLLLAVIP